MLTQRDRIRAVFGLDHDQPLPKVDIDSLLVYQDYLQGVMDHCGFCDAEYHGGVARQPVWFLSICDGVDPSAGLLCLLFGDSLHGEFPLCDVTLSHQWGFWEDIEDYKYWFRQGTNAPF